MAIFYVSLCNRRRRLKTLSSLVLILLLTTSFSIAQINEKKDARLLARAEIQISSTQIIIKDDETFNRNSENPPNNDTEINNRANSNSDQLSPISLELGEGSSDTSLLINKVLKLEKDHDLTYKSPSLKAEDLPLVMSSADRKTVSVVLPPFLYFKQQF